MSEDPLKLGILGVLLIGFPFVLIAEGAMGAMRQTAAPVHLQTPLGILAIIWVLALLLTLFWISRE